MRRGPRAPAFAQDLPSRRTDRAPNLIDMNAFAVAELAGTPAPFLATPGAAVNCQCWARHPGFAAPDATMLTDAVGYQVAI